MIKKTFQFICPSLIFFPSFDGRFCPDRPVERRDEDDFCCISSSRPAKDAILGPRFFLSSEFGPATAMSTTEEHDPILSKQQEDYDRPIRQKPQKFQSLAVELFSVIIMDLPTKKQTLFPLMPALDICTKLVQVVF